MLEIFLGWILLLSLEERLESELQIKLRLPGLLAAPVLTLAIRSGAFVGRDVKNV